MRVRTYSELIALPTFMERFEYLQSRGGVGVSTFGFDRYFNQKFYKSGEWLSIRDQIIVRDNACDLALPDRPLDQAIYIHHMNPISIHDIENATDWLIDPEFLVCCSYKTHTAIHFGNGEDASMEPIIRTPHDTSPWRVQR